MAYKGAIFLLVACILAAEGTPIHHIPCAPSDAACVFAYVSSSDQAAPVNHIVLHDVHIELPEYRYLADFGTLTVEGLAGAKILSFELDEHNRATVTQQMVVTVHGDLIETYATDNGDSLATDDLTILYPNMTVRSEFDVVSSVVDGQHYVEFGSSRSEVLQPLPETVTMTDAYQQRIKEDKHIAAVQKQFMANFGPLQKRWAQVLVDDMYNVLFAHYRTVLRNTPVFVNEQ